MFNVFGTAKHEFKDEIFVILSKDSVNSPRYTHLKWSKTRHLIKSDDTLMNSCYIGYIASISVNALVSNHDQANEEQDGNVFFIKIEWNKQAAVQSLVLYHYDLNFLWYFAKALTYCVETKGIKNKPSITEQTTKINVLCASYNVGASSPTQSLRSWLKPNVLNNIIPDFYVISLQEIIDLGSKHLLANHQYECFWESAIYKLLSKDYFKIESIVRGGLVLFLFAKKNIIPQITNIAFGGFNVGTMGIANKAGIAIRIEIGEQRICFIATHLPSGMQYNTLRNDAFYRIYAHLTFEGDEKMQDIDVEDHDIIFFFGDLNYRLNIDKSQIGSVYSLIKQNKIQKLLKYDQLIESKRRNKAFQGFIESEIKFLPTYKYQPGTGNFEMRKNKALRMPSYTDRILYKISKRNIDIKTIAYDSVNNLSLSDHKPIYGLFQINISNDFVENDRYSLELTRSLEKVNFLQKNYSLHLMQGIKDLQCAQNDSKQHRNNIIDNIAKSQSELVENMESLLKCLKTNYGEMDTQN